MSESVIFLIPTINAGNEKPFRATWVKEDDNHYFGVKMDTEKLFSCSKTYWQLAVFLPSSGGNTGEKIGKNLIDEKTDIESVFAVGISERLERLLQDPLTPVADLQEAALAAGFRLGVTIQPLVSFPNESRG